jgi:hypothetical protein
MKRLLLGLRFFALSLLELRVSEQVRENVVQPLKRNKT